MLKLEAEAKIKTTFGEFTVKGFSFCEQECITLVKGEINGSKNLITRIQSSCLFGESFHAIDCDCNWQILSSLRRIENEGVGIFIYLFQEGRGVGIFDKIRAFKIQQDDGCDTVEAFRKLGVKSSDLRTYEIAANILSFENVHGVDLLTNNRSKADSLNTHGINTKMIPLEMEADDYKALSKYMSKEDIQDLVKYLRVKKDKLGHKIVTRLADDFLKEISKKD